MPWVQYESIYETPAVKAKHQTYMDSTSTKAYVMGFLLGHISTSWKWIYLCLIWQTSTIGIGIPRVGSERVNELWVYVIDHNNTSSSVLTVADWTSLVCNHSWQACVPQFSMQGDSNDVTARLLGALRGPVRYALHNRGNTNYWLSICIFPAIATHSQTQYIALCSLKPQIYAVD
jgi:hypothetical protein